MNYFTKANILANNTIALAQSHLQEEIKVGSYMVQVKSRLAEGGFGVVDLVSDIYTKKDFVLKRCNIDRPESFEIARKEISMLQKFKGPHVVALLDSAIIQKNKTSREALLLLEYYPGGHLLNRLLERGGNYLPIDTILRMFGQLCLSISVLHLSRPSIVHRDIKLENVLFGEDGKIRLCDFGSCIESPTYIRNMEERNIVEEHILKETTQMYRAPEMVDLYMRNIITEKTDIWALGCMLYAICFLIHPFQDGSTLSILNAKVIFPTNSLYSEDVHELILRMLDIDPECRPNIIEVIESTKALASGQALPPHTLSEEAEICRQNRMEANKIRESKLKSKAKTTTIPTGPKKAVAVSSNSAAARRLAAMRGQQIETNNNNNTINNHTLSVKPSNIIKNNNNNNQITKTQEVLDFDFDPFNVNITDQSTFNNNITTSSNNNSFSQVSSFSNNGFNTFDDTNSFDPFSDNDFSNTINTITNINSNNNKSNNISNNISSKNEQDLFFVSPGMKKQSSKTTNNNTTLLSFDDDNENNNSLVDFSSDFNQSNSNILLNNINISNNINTLGSNSYNTTPSTSNSRNPSFTSNQLFQSVNLSANINTNDILLFSSNDSVINTSNTIELTNQFSNEFDPFNNNNNNSCSITTSNKDTNNNVNTTTPIPAKPPKPVSKKHNSSSNNISSSATSPIKPLKTMSKVPSAPSLIDFDDITTSNNNTNSNSIISNTNTMGSFAVHKGPPKPSKRQSVSLIDFNDSQTIINNNNNNSNPFASDGLLGLSNTQLDLLDLPNPQSDMNQQQQQQQIKQMNIQNDVMNLYNLPRGPPPPVPTTAPPGIKPAKPTHLSQQSSSVTSMLQQHSHPHNTNTMIENNNYYQLNNNIIGNPTSIQSQPYNLSTQNSNNQKQYQANNPFNF